MVIHRWWIIPALSISLLVCKLLAPGPGPIRIPNASSSDHPTAVMPSAAAQPTRTLAPPAGGNGQGNLLRSNDAPGRPAPTTVAAPATTAPPAPTSEPTTAPAAPSPTANCDPAYPDVCIAPPPPRLSCADILPYTNIRVVTHPDPHGLDGNDDGIGCEQ